MRRILALVLLAGVLSACGGTSPTATAGASVPAATGASATPTTAATATTAPTQPPAAPGSVKAVQDYLQAVVTKNVDKVSTLSCKDWEQQAIQEVDSLQAVTAELSSDLACTQTGADASGALVKCQGKILITYNTEKQELDLSLRTYKVTQSGGDWLVCGYQQ